ncbi:MAG: nitroreductase family protein [Thiobacillus sp.]
MTHPPSGTLRALLDRARWAPSADNTQPWRFHILDEAACRIDYRPHAGMGVFNLDHYTGHLAMGGLLETLRLAAGACGWDVDASVAGGESEDQAFSVHARLVPAKHRPDPLADWIEARSTQRRLMLPHGVSEASRLSLARDLPCGYRLVWMTGLTQRHRVARLLSQVGKVRLLIPETYEVHRDTVDWRARHSIDRIPAAAIGVDPLTRRIMAWALRSRARVAWLNRFYGHLLPRLEMDYLPALACGGHFFLVAAAGGDSLSQRLAHGAAMQRLWLSAARHGLQFQPEMAALVFARYLRAGTVFTTHRSMARLMAQTSQGFDRLLGAADWTQTVFMGRVGSGGAIHSRSLRQPLAALCT